MQREERHTKQFTEQTQAEERNQSTTWGNVWVVTSLKVALQMANRVTTVGKIIISQNASKLKLQRTRFTVEEETEDFFVDSVGICNAVNAAWIVPLSVNETIILFKLDTGAQVNLLLDDYKTLKVKSRISLYAG